MTQIPPQILPRRCVGSENIPFRLVLIKNLHTRVVSENEP